MRRRLALWTYLFSFAQVLKDYQGSISLKELSEMTAIKVEDVVSTLQHLNLIQYQKGQHVICAAPKLIERSVSSDMLCDPNCLGGKHVLRLSGH